MYKAVRQLEFNPDDFKGEVIDEKSETIPGQALSVSEVLYKFTNGTLGNIALPIHYDFDDETEVDDDVFDSFDPTQSPDFDLSDAEAYLRMIEEKKALKSSKNAPKASDERTQQISDETTGTKQEES
jgi:hypothetical protein